MAFFVMVVAAAEVVVGLAIIMSIFRTRRPRRSTMRTCSSTSQELPMTAPAGVDR